MLWITNYPSTAKLSIPILNHPSSHFRLEVVIERRWPAYNRHIYDFVLTQRERRRAQKGAVSTRNGVSPPSNVVFYRPITVIALLAFLPHEQLHQRTQVSNDRQNTNHTTPMSISSSNTVQSSITQLHISFPSIHPKTKQKTKKERKTIHQTTTTATTEKPTVQWVRGYTSREDTSVYT